MHCTTKYMLIMLISLYSAAFAASSSSQASSSSSSAPTSAHKWNDASHLFGVAGNGRYEVRSHLTEEFFACSIAQTISEEHSREDLSEVSDGSLARMVKDWRLVEDTSPSSPSFIGKKCGVFLQNGEDAVTRVSLILSLILNRENIHVDIIKENKLSIVSSSKSYSFDALKELVVVKVRDDAYKYFRYESGKDLTEQAKELLQPEDELAVVIDRKKLLESLQKHEEKACVIS